MLVKLQNAIVTLEGSFAVSDKYKHTLNIQFNNCAHTCLPNDFKTHLHKSLHTKLYNTFIHNYIKL